MINLVLKAFKHVRTVTTPTPYLTLVIDKTEAFTATWNQIKPKSTNCYDEFLRRSLLTVKLLLTVKQICVLIGLSQVGLLDLLLFAEVVYS